MRGHVSNILKFHYISRKGATKKTMDVNCQDETGLKQQSARNQGNSYWQKVTPSVIILSDTARMI